MTKMTFKLKLNDREFLTNLTKNGNRNSREFERAYILLALDKVEGPNLKYVDFGHFGDSHLHLNFLPQDTDEVLECKRVYAEICI